ncbi:potassium-transporting ATPase subunit KdpC [Paenibacillus koleovorans]|uniref:potassium-transporting ATPase subunit KdpC n=1 Tax=Paenibacillus koleovorans TaxID=121608 RepID=UPI001FEC0B2D|nr:potassium-transporting ATPase subunit KdpC [Paenibacillus koleovorans]
MWVAIRAGLVFLVLCGLIYPLVCTGVAQVLMPGRANGSLIESADGAVVGSELIGQKFEDPKHFQSRVSSIDYKAEASGSNNYAPSNPALQERMEASIEEWNKLNPEVPSGQVPLALLTNSGSGLDPHITPESARVQVPRISRLTGVSAAQLEQLVDDHTEGRDLGLFGEPRVHVLKLNMALDVLLAGK